MAPLTHLLLGWVVAAKGTDTARDARLVALAGIAPDADGLGLVADLAGKALTGKTTHYYATYHHYLLHGLYGAILIAALAAMFAHRGLRVAALALLVFHLHLLCDLVGSRGPAPEDLWPIFYFGPFEKDPMWLWSGQWRLDSWINRLLTLFLFAWALRLAVVRGHSFVGVFSRRADRVFVGVLQKWAAGLSARFRPEAAKSASHGRDR